jgi:hypothetical protein
MKYVIGGFGIIIIVAAFIAIIVAFVGRDPIHNDIDPDEIITELSDFADDSSEVSFTTYGPIVGHEEFKAIRITVNDSHRRLDILRGYDLAVDERIEIANTAAAYEAFLYALEEANFTATLDGQEAREDGKCPTNRRHVYRLEIDDEERLRTWSSPCRGQRGNFGGEARLVERLFQGQIPDYRDITREVRL